MRQKCCGSSVIQTCVVGNCENLHDLAICANMHIKVTFRKMVHIFVVDQCKNLHDLIVCANVHRIVASRDNVHILAIASDTNFAQQTYYGS